MYTEDLLGAAIAYASEIMRIVNQRRNANDTNLFSVNCRLSTVNFALRLNQCAKCGTLVVYTVCFAARVRGAMARRIGCQALLSAPASKLEKLHGPKVRAKFL